MAGKPLYDREIEIFIDDFWKENYRAPTFREIKDGTGAKSTSTVSYAIDRLVRRGVLAHRDNLAPVWLKELIDMRLFIEAGIDEYPAE